MNFRRFIAISIFLMAAASLAIAQETTIRVNVTPEEAYIFVDGQPVVHRSNTLIIAPGEHTIGVYNYGYVPQLKKVLIESGQNPPINARLEPVPGMVSGPWGRIQIEGVHGDALVYLNGTGPEFFVAHADEANNNFLAQQTIVAPVGTHQLYIVDHKTNRPVWSGPIEVKANQRAILYANRGMNGEIIYKNWADGAKLNTLKRFEAGTATATIAVAPVTGKLSADREEVKCGEPVRLSWASAEGAHTTVIADNKVLAETFNGELTVEPKQNTTYEFRTVGPGGTATSSATVRVDNTVHASLVPSAPEIKFVKVGDKVTEQGTADLKWTASNADAVHIDPIGLVSGNEGTETVKAMPKQTSEGPVDETQTYKIVATNVCGGSDTSMATVRVTGSIEPEQVAQLETPPELPQTASPLPLIFLLGAGALGSGLIVRMLARAR